jgi:hypothetical protein
VFVFSAKDAVAALIKRLAHRNANVQLYTLEVGLLYFARLGGIRVADLLFRL